MSRLLFSFGLALAVCVVWPGDVHSQLQREDVAENGADAAEDGAKAKPEHAKPAQDEASTRDVKPETERQIDQLLLRDVIRDIPRR